MSTQKIAVAAVMSLVGGYLLFSDPDVVLRSSDGRWADAEFSSKGRSFDIVAANFALYKLRCHAPEARLVRATPRRWFNLFAWPSYLSDAKWRLPYSDAHPEIGDYYPPVTAQTCSKGVTHD